MMKQNEMTAGTVTLRLEAEVRHFYDSLADVLGISRSAVITMALRGVMFEGNRVADRNRRLEEAASLHEPADLLQAAAQGILILGGIGSGKSSVAAKIARLIERCCSVTVIRVEDFFVSRDPYQGLAGNVELATVRLDCSEPEAVQRVQSAVDNLRPAGIVIYDELCRAADLPREVGKGWIAVDRRITPEEWYTDARLQRLFPNAICCDRLRTFADDLRKDFGAGPRHGRPVISDTDLR